MSEKDIINFLTLFDKHGNVVSQKENIAFKAPARQRTFNRWNGVSATYPVAASQPFKNGFLQTDEDNGVGHFSWGADNTASPGIPYPRSFITMNTVDYAHYRATGSIPTIAAGSVPRVIGAIVSESGQNQSFNGSGFVGNNVLSIVDVPIDYTQIGANIWPHPMHSFSAATVSTTLGASYITFTNSSLWESVNSAVNPGAFNIVRIENGADAGYYFVHHFDSTNNRVYLRCINGLNFAALATASAIICSLGPGRRAWFNEVGIVHNSTGELQTGGRYNPRKDDPYLRGSFIMRLVIDKSGSTDAAAAVAAEQQGSYHIALVPWMYGDGILGGQTPDALDWMPGVCQPLDTVPPGFGFFEGGVNGICLDWPNQRCWMGYTNAANNSGIAMWRWKTNESFREVANYLGTAAQASMLTPALVLASGDQIVSISDGSTVGSCANWVYVGIGHTSGGNGGVAVIKPDFTTLQYTTASSPAFPSGQLGACQLDKSRTRIGAAASVSTNGSAQITATGAAFTNADIGKAIKITGVGADSGTYIIKSPIVSGTQVDVETTVGGTVTFTSQSGGTFELSDRLYFFFNNGSTNAGVMRYMEALSPGIWRTRAVSFAANALTVAVRQTTINGIKMGQPQLSSVDPASGDIYWISVDGVQQINKYDVAAGTHSKLVVGDVQTPLGGTGTISNITKFTAIHVNSKFNDIWVGTDNGHVKLRKNSFSGTGYKRYFGIESTTYENPAGFKRSAGAQTAYGGGSSSYVRGYHEHTDGRMGAVVGADGSANDDRVGYSQEADNWTTRQAGGTTDNRSTFASNEVHDPYGNFMQVCFSVVNSSTKVRFLSYEVEYQWDVSTSKWLPKEVAQSGMPNKYLADTTNPGCVSKPIHAGLEETLFGVKVGFLTAKIRDSNPAAPHNNEFLGRGGQSQTTATNGTLTSGSSTFEAATSFTLGDVGKLLRVEVGAGLTAAELTTYKISALLTPNTKVTLTKMDGTAFSASATVTSAVTYTVWDLGTPGANAGPENITFFIADGVAIDNVQDLSGMTFEHYMFKTRHYENSEARKFCVDNPLAAPGATATKVYFETYPVSTNNTDAANSNHRALPGAELTNGRQLVDGFIDKALNGSGQRASAPSTGTWAGNLASTTSGYSAMVDFGVDVEIGFIQVRVAGNTPSTYHILNTISANGIIGNIFKANTSGGAPVASSASRTTGTQISCTVNTTTVTASSGDFLGTSSVSASDGVISSGGSILTSASAPFVAGDLQKVLKLTVGGDVGSYRIINVNSSSIVTIQNLDQTSKLWTASASGITFSVWDAVRQNDMLVSGVEKLCVERLLSTTTLQVRVGPSATLTLAAWSCRIPTWDLVKRLSYNTEALPPEVANNKTWGSTYGREVSGNSGDYKFFFDLTDLTTSQRTGRWWKWAAMPRFNGNNIDCSHNMCTFEFYDTSGNRLGISKYDWTDQALQNADFLYSYLNRADFIQSANDAVSHISTVNGLATLGGANGDTITLASANEFLGFQSGPTFTDGNLVGGSATINSTSAVFMSSASVGKFIKIVSGTYSGSYFRIASVVSSTQVTVANPSGVGSVSFSGSETGISFTVHEGIATGGTYPDRFVFLADNREFSIASISNDVKTITITESLQPTRTGATWEIRRPAYDTSSATTEPSKLARLTRPTQTYPIQSGDICQDSRGAIRFFSEDIGPGLGVNSTFQRSGSIAGGTDVVTGTGFTKDDIGRLLYITSSTPPANLGVWEISNVTSPTSLTVKNHYTGAAVTLALSVTMTYQIVGDRRFRLTKYVTGLRA